MHHGCDVCHHFRPEANLRERTITSLAFGARSVELCETHRRIAEASGATTFETLRELYGESDGRRSFVSRRTSGERRDGGRRSTDA